MSMSMKAAYTDNNLTCRITYGKRALPPLGATQVLIRVHSVGVNPLDWKFPRMIGPLYPLSIIVGHDFSGRIEQVGKRVRTLKVGQYVSGTKLWSRCGSCAEFVAVDASAVAPMPKGLKLEEAGAAPLAALTALQGLKLAGLHHRQSVVVIGAAGGVGHCAVQIARAFGATVTGVCGTANLDFVRALGASAVVDYQKNDFTKLISGVDVVLDTVGKHSLHRLGPVLAARGTYLTTMPNPQSMLEIGRSMMTALSPFKAQRAMLISVRANSKDLTTIGRFIETGQLKVHVGQRFTLPEAAAAYAIGREGHTRGKNVIVVDPSV